MEVAMPEHPNVQRIRDAYAALTEGDLAEAPEGHRTHRDLSYRWQWSAEWRPNWNR